MVAERGLDCVEVVELVTDYLEGALDPATAAAVEAHLGRCEGCLEYVAQIRGTADLLGKAPAVGISDEARASLVDAFREWSSRQPSDSV